jgi:hypothetical protein
MKKSFTSTLVLAGVFALVFGWYMVWEKNLKPERDKKASEAKEIVQLDPKQLQELVIEREKLPEAGAKAGTPGKYETIRVKRINGRWTLVEPVSDPGDDAAIQNLATTLTTTKYDEILKEGVKDWAPYGLEQPKLKITGIVDQNTKASLWVGNDTPVGYSSYVRKADSDTLYQTAKAIRTAFERKIDDLRERRLINWVRADVAEVEIQGPGGEVIVKRGSGEDQWRLARQDAAADLGEWNKSLNAILELRATEFPSDKAANLSKFGLAKPHIRVELKKAGGAEKLQILIGKVKDKFYVKRADRDTVFEVSKEGIDKLERPASALIDRVVARFNRFSASRIRIEHTGTVGNEPKKETVELVKVGPDWTFTADQSKASQTKVETFLTTLQDMRLTDYTALPKAGPGMQIVVTEETKKDGKTESKDTIDLRFSSFDANTVLGTRTGFDRAFKIKLSDFKPIHLGKADFAESAKAANSEPSKTEAVKKPNS